MCIQHSEDGGEPALLQTSDGNETQDASEEPFPWDVGVFDAHCHPTDTMSSIGSITSMKARALTAMATRAQDQDLVYEVASSHGVHDGKTLSAEPLAPTDQNRIVPSFGWHPWFSYQLYDDTVPNPTYDGTPAGKTAHYDQVLAPKPSSKDDSFSSGLGEPRPLSEYLEETRKRLEKFPLALVGEIGIDKAFRLPTTWTSAEEAKREEGLTPGGREGRRLSPYRVQLTHQAAILRAQLELAGRMDRPVSVHGVQAHGVLYDTIASCWKGHEKEVLSRRQKRQIATGAEDFSDDTDEDSDDDDVPNRKDIPSIPARHGSKENGPANFPRRICLHSYSGHVEQLKMYIHPSVPAKVYFSFSVAINWGAGGNEKTEEAIRAVPDDRLLVESDLHIAGEKMDSQLEEVCRRICRIKGWDLREGVERLGRNWRAFVLG
ncbi:hypothetical protein F5B22DRAFT_178172 [Xylaria bambusicola]|uniref:uncharacterized protein n=1 Tax=Xylaria bambusicola TaxID=326684 RepID=UPI00200756A1|nr:uncharacterized protein F5B22DRAFT_178172 [Xylaria bambusicola]KAI0516730.1 hypothetical protein F5B22DRAFT_178172 [Xylaria bambusicola]